MNKFEECPTRELPDARRNVEGGNVDYVEGQRYYVLTLLEKHQGEERNYPTKEEWENIRLFNK